MISFSVVLSGFLAGIVLSIPPGPATTAVLSGIRHSYSAAFKTIFQIFVADVIVSAGCLALFEPLSHLAGLPIIQVIAGIFLILFSIRAFFAINKKILPSPKSAFHLTVLNPGVWLSMITVMALLLNPQGLPLWSLILFLGVFELGVFIWYLFLILLASKFSERTHEWVLKLAFFMIAVTGILFVIRSTAHLNF